MLGQILSAVLLVVLLGERIAATGWDDGFGVILRSLLLGDLMVTGVIVAATLAFMHFGRLWRQRDVYIAHDGARLYRGNDAAWPLSSIRDVVVSRGELGVTSLRLVVDDDSEVTRELVKLYMLEEAPETVRGGILFAVGGVRGFPAASSMN
ncbi:MAG: hypothetical protein U0S50_10565 [Sphingopyxis sp.]|uniref:hypothetical protein n=1 Tax=Sphingopyxis sp. TaxID=1908224 RepID=UPI002ABCA32B|nr:hypothetical protein [Sphingopyxis sp.]MDZ3832248.1 hypothetical protein [Sphingopyxis sp.]